MTSLLSPEITIVASLTERCDRCSAAAKLAVELTSGGSLSFDGTFIIFTPTPDYFGPASFTYAITDGQGGSATATVNIDITATPIVLTVTNGPSANPFRFILRGHVGSVYSLQTSSNLHNWSTWRNITNTAGSTLVIDPSATNAPVRFYRAQFVQ